MGVESPPIKFFEAQHVALFDDFASLPIWFMLALGVACVIAVFILLGALKGLWQKEKPTINSESFRAMLSLKSESSLSP